MVKPDWYTCLTYASPSFNCTITNNMPRITAPTKSPITRDEFQGYVAPPHCNASSKQTMAGMTRAAPSRSSCKIRFMKERLSGLFSRGICIYFLVKSSVSCRIINDREEESTFRDILGSTRCKRMMTYMQEKEDNCDSCCSYRETICDLVQADFKKRDELT